MNLRESYYVSSNSHYNISYIHLSPQNPLFDSKIPTNPFAKAIGLFLELLQRPYPHQRKAKEHYPQRPTQIESKVFSTAFCLKSFVWYHSHFKAFTPVTPPKTPQKKKLCAMSPGRSQPGWPLQHRCFPWDATPLPRCATPNAAVANRPMADPPGSACEWDEPVEGSLERWNWHKW